MLLKSLAVFLFIFNIYYFSKTVVACNLILNFLISVTLYIMCTKYYFPKMQVKKDKEDFKTKKQLFQEKYLAFERKDSHLISIGRIFFAMMSYFWIRFFLVVLTFGCMNLSLR